MKEVTENEENLNQINTIFATLSKQYDEGRKTLASLGLLINSGGIIAILTYAKIPLKGSLKWALLSFVFSIIILFLKEFFQVKSYKDSMRQLLEFQQKSDYLTRGEYSKLKIFNQSKCSYFWEYGAIVLGGFGVWKAIQAII